MLRSQRNFLLNVWGLLALPLLAHALALFWSSHRFSLVVPVRCEGPLTLKVDVYTGIEYGDALRFSADLPGSASGQQARFALPACHVRAVRLHLRAAGPAAPVRVGSLRFISDAETKLGWDPSLDPLPAARFTPVREVRAVTAEGDEWVRVDPEPGGSDPTGELRPAEPIGLEFSGAAFGARLAVDLLAFLLIGLGALLLWRRSGRVQDASRRLERAVERGLAVAERFCRGHPHRAIWLVGLAGVLVSSYPVVFRGRSLVSPNLTIPLLYGHLPTLPGYSDAAPGNNQLSDVAATMLQAVPWAVTQHRAIFQDHELPVWNRYDAGGVPLLGQGLSMIGDPLHWIPLLANSAAWAWDLKFLLAKLLFAAGIGLTVRAATRHLPSALLLAFCSSFLGFFLYWLNHVTYFGVCYAPWILYAWLRLIQGEGRRPLALLLLANWMEFNSGTAKESAILLLNLNACGALAFWLSPGRLGREKAGAFLRLVLAGVCFTLVAAPLWLTTLDTIGRSWNSYKVPGAWQIQPGLLIGLFDDIYYRQFSFGERMFNPGLNFVVLLGVALAVGHFKSLGRDRLFAALALGAIPALAIVFGVVPAEFIAAIPFLGNIVHVDLSFSCPLLVLAPVLAGFGFRECWRRFDAADWKMDVVAAAAVLALLLGAFAGLTEAAQRTNIDPHRAMTELTVSAFCWAYTAALSTAFVALPFVLRQIRRERAATLLGFIPLLVLCLGTMMWRNMLHLPGLSFRYVLSPGVRADLTSPSPAAADIAARQQAAPGRAMGFASQLAPGFAAVYGLESPSGPDALQNAYYHDLLESSGIRYWSSWYLVADRPAFPGAHKFFDLLNVRYYLDDARYADEHADLKRLGRFDLDVYGSETAWPRAFFTDAVSTHGTLKDFCQRVVNGDGRPFVSVTETEPMAPGLRPLMQTAGQSVTPATDYRFTSRTTSFRVHAPQAGVIALLECYQLHDVEVTVNGKSAPHFRVNEAFSGLYVPAAGDYAVSYRYWPRFLTSGLWLSALGCLLLVPLFIFSGAPGPRRSGQIPAPAGSGPAAAATRRDGP